MDCVAYLSVGEGFFFFREQRSLFRYVGTCTSLLWLGLGGKKAFVSPRCSYPHGSGPGFECAREHVSALHFSPFLVGEATYMGTKSVNLMCNSKLQIWATLLGGSLASKLIFITSSPGRDLGHLPDQHFSSISVSFDQGLLFCPHPIIRRTSLVQFILFQS